MKYCNLVKSLMDIRTSKIVEDIMSAFPGSRIDRVVIEDEFRDDGFGRIVRDDRCGLPEIMCGCDSKRDRGSKG